MSLSLALPERYPQRREDQAGGLVGCDMPGQDVLGEQVNDEGDVAEVDEANLIFLDLYGPGGPIWQIGLAMRGCQAGHRALFATASLSVDRLADAHTSRGLEAELLQQGSKFSCGCCRQESLAAYSPVMLRTSA